MVDLPVGLRNQSPNELHDQLRRAIVRLQDELPPNTGITLFVFDFGDGGNLGYISNATRADMIEALREFLAKQEAEQHPSQPRLVDGRSA